MAKRMTVPISTARARLFELADLVRTSADDTAVILEQRGDSEQVALVREARLSYLEDRAGQLDRQQGQTPFSLAGSLSSRVEDATLLEELRDIRRGWASRGGTRSGGSRTTTRRPRR